MGEEIDPIDIAEILYRRIPASQGWYDEATKVLNSAAFHPNRNDETGISIVRGKYKTPEQAAMGRSGKTYYLAVLKANELAERQINAVSRPDLPSGETDISHAELPGLNAGNRRSFEVAGMEEMLAQELTIEVLGPFVTPNKTS